MNLHPCPYPELAIFPEFFLTIYPIVELFRTICRAHQHTFETQVMAMPHNLELLLVRRLVLPLPSVPFCLTLSASAKTDLAQASQRVKRSHILGRIVPSPKPPYIVTLLGQVDRAAPPSSVTTATIWLNLKPCSVQLLSHICRARRGSLTALGMKLNSSISS